MPLYQQHAWQGREDAASALEQSVADLRKVKGSSLCLHPFFHRSDHVQFTGVPVDVSTILQLPAHVVGLACPLTASQVHHGQLAGVHLQATCKAAETCAYE